MAKKKLTTEQKIAKYKKKRRVSLLIKIMAGIIAFALLIPATYYGYYYLVFGVMPQNDYNPDKILGVGYSRPLHMIPEYDKSNSYILAYYYNGHWSVVDDSQKLKDNRDKFTIYKEDDQWYDEEHLQLLLFRGTFLYNVLPLSKNTLIDNRCFKDCTQIMTMEEFLDYCKEKGLQTDYIH